MATTVVILGPPDRAATINSAKQIEIGESHNVKIERLSGSSITDSVVAIIWISVIIRVLEFELPIAYCPLPIARCLLLIACSQFPVASCLLPIAYWLPHGINIANLHLSASAY